MALLDHVMMFIFWIVTAIVLLALYAFRMLRISHETGQRVRADTLKYMLGIIAFLPIADALATSKFPHLGWDHFLMLPALINIGLLWLSRLDPYMALSAEPPIPGSLQAKTWPKTPKGFLIELCLVGLALFGAAFAMTP